MYKGVIFDFNGTLFWDTHLHNEAWDLFLKSYDIHLTAEEKHHKLHGKNNTQLIKELFEIDLTEDEVKEIARKKELIYQDLVRRDELKLADGVVNLLEYLKKKGVVYTIVTASDKLNMDFFMDYLNLDQWFDREKVIYADGKLKPKPFPDMFLAAMKLMNIECQLTVIFEDSETGLLAASRAEPGKIIIVNSTGRAYTNWDFDVVKTFQEIDKKLFS